MADTVPQVLTEIQSGDGLSLAAAGRLFPGHRENRHVGPSMRGHDVKGCVMYCDPLYPAGTRSAPDVYGEYEMTDDHREFLAVAKSIKHAKVLISGYLCEMYDEALRDWDRHTFEIANHAAGGKSKERKTEVVWTNY